MLILLPPSEGKATPTRGRALALDRLSVPELAPARSAVLDALVGLCTADAAGAVRVLGLTPGQHDHVAANAALRTAPTARAERVYTGVLYDALDLAGLDTAARRRAGRWLRIQSSLFGLLGPADPIPAYRLSGEVTLPGLGKVAGHWRRHLEAPAAEAVGSGLLVDLRSGTYAAFWRPARDLAARTATVRVLHETAGRRSVVSHFNKATKGRLVRDLLEDGGIARRPAELAEQLRDLGWTVETQAPGPRGHQLDVVVTAL